LVGGYAQQQLLGFRGKSRPATESHQYRTRLFSDGNRKAVQWTFPGVVKRKFYVRLAPFRLQVVEKKLGRRGAIVILNNIERRIRKRNARDVRVENADDELSKTVRNLLSIRIEPDTGQSR
jgi:hypothetical protein